ncbi:ABC transporter ATP-binding protein [soil metagenome]
MTDRPLVMEPAKPAAAQPATPVTVVVDDLRVTYRILVSGAGEKKRTAREGSVRSSLWQRATRRPRARTMSKVRALRGVSFVAHEGETIGVIGHNGSGKSTLLRAIAGVVTPTSGEVYAEGEPALLGINAVLIRDLSGERNITLGGLALGLSPSDIKRRRDDIVATAGLGKHIDLPMRALSSGMGARLRFSIATAATPRVLLIDEALATGDARFRQRSKERIGEIREQAGTVFLVSHGLGSIQETCSRCLWLHRGKLRMDGPPDEVIAAYRRWVNSRRRRGSKKRSQSAAENSPGGAADED